MEELKSLLSKEITSENYLQVFEKIADSLIRHHSIVCGNKTFRLAEIEFYYYDKEKMNDEWNRKTYPRTDKKAGELFFHYSGVDICFPSDFRIGRFGGILIRSLFDEGAKQYISGPMLCANEVLNVCAETKIWPQVIPYHKRECNILQTSRYGIKYDGEDFSDSLCFYDEGVANTEPLKCLTWDYNKGETKYNTRYYAKRFAK